MAKDSDRRDLFPGALELMILQSLRFRPMHGYALVKHIQQVSGDLLQVEEGSLYPALQRLLREGAAPIASPSSQIVSSRLENLVTTLHQMRVLAAAAQ